MNAPFTPQNVEFPAESGAASIRASLAALHDAIRDLEAGAELLAEERRRDIRRAIEAAGAEFARRQVEPGLRCAFHAQLQTVPDKRLRPAARSLAAHLALLAGLDAEGELTWCGTKEDLARMAGVSHDTVTRATEELLRERLIDTIIEGNGNRTWQYRLNVWPKSRHALGRDDVLDFVRAVDAATSAGCGG